MRTQQLRLFVCLLALLPASCRRATDTEVEQGKLLRDTLEQMECATESLSHKEEDLARHVDLKLTAMEHELLAAIPVPAGQNVTIEFVTESSMGDARIDNRRLAPGVITDLTKQIGDHINERRRIKNEIAHRTASASSAFPLAVKNAVQDDFNEGITTLYEWQSQLEQLSVAIQFQKAGLILKEVEETRAAFQTNGYVVNSMRNSIRLLTEQLRLDPGNAEVDGCQWDTSPSPAGTRQPGK